MLAAAVILHVARIDASIAVLLVLAGSCLWIAPAIVWLATRLLAWRALPRPQAWLAGVFAREPAPAAILGMATLVVAIALLAGASIVETSELHAARTSVQAAYPGDAIERRPTGVIASTAEERRATIAPIEAIFALLRVALAITFAIAIVGVMSGAFSAVLDRRDQIATLRAIGASRRQIVRMILAESALRAIAGCALGALAAFAIAFITLARVRIAVPGVELVAVLAAGAAATVFSALPGSWIVGRIRADRVAAP